MKKSTAVSLAGASNKMDQVIMARKGGSDELKQQYYGYQS